MLNKMKNRKGFTLAELIVVVGIIAVMVAITIPVFTTQLEKSKEAADLANIRAACAEASVAAMSGEDGCVESVPMTQTAGWSKIDNPHIAGVTADLPTVKQGDIVTVTMNAIDGSVSFSVK